MLVQCKITKADGSIVYFDAKRDANGAIIFEKAVIIYNGDTLSIDHTFERPGATNAT